MEKPPQQPPVPGKLLRILQAKFGSEQFWKIRRKYGRTERGRRKMSE